MRRKIYIKGLLYFLSTNIHFELQGSTMLIFFFLSKNSVAVVVVVYTINLYGIGIIKNLAQTLYSC